MTPEPTTPLIDDEEAFPETPRMRFSRMKRHELQRECSARSLRGDGTNPEIIERLVAFEEQGGVSPDLVAGGTPLPLDDEPLIVEDDESQTQAPGPQTPAAGGMASAPAAGPSGTTSAAPDWAVKLSGQLDQFSAHQAAPAAAPPPDAPAPRDQFAGLTRASAREASRPRVGFDDHSNTFRAEFPIGNRGGALDDPTHFALIEATHAAAREAGLSTRGAPYGGERVGFGVQRGMRTAIYQVSARQRA